MPVFDIFSRRRDRATKPLGPEVYVYDRMPDSLVNQIVMIWTGLLERVSQFQIKDSYLTAEGIWATVERIITREYGMKGLPHKAGDYSSVEDRVLSFCENTHVTDQRLDTIEIVFRLIARSNIAGKEMRSRN